MSDGIPALYLERLCFHRGTIRPPLRPPTGKFLDVHSLSLALFLVWGAPHSHALEIGLERR